MEKEKQNLYGKIIAYILLFLLIASLVPILILGKYNHPTGDDYYYGVETHHIWESTHDPLAMAQEACRGVATQYQIWQGTYSAMFLMYLPPNAFGENVYHIVTGLILALLIGGIFYLTYQILCGFLKADAHSWLALSALISILCIQTVDFQSESFFWYNGSMYYTGFFSLSLFFSGIVCRYIREACIRHIVVLSLLALFLAGGNYVSFLPTMLVFLCTIALLFLIKDYRKMRGLLIVFSFMAAGFILNAMAPGNQMRQNGMWKIPAWKAILKAIRHGFLFLQAWTGIWLILGLVIITPLLWKIFDRISFRFPYPLIVIGLAFGIFCSMSCPTYYTMNAVGPARAAAIMYYGFIIFWVTGYGYLLGYLSYIKKKRVVSDTLPGKKILIYLQAHPIPVRLAATLLVVFCITLQIFTGSFLRLTTVRALRCLSSGEAAAYEAEYQARLAILYDPAITNVVFTPYRHPADLLYVGDLSGDAASPTNLRVAQYFGKESVLVNWE